MLEILNKEKVNKKSKCRYLTSEVMWHKNCRRQLFNLTYLSCRFNKYGNETNVYKVNSNKNDNNNKANDDNTDNKNRNIDNGNINVC